MSACCVANVRVTLAIVHTPGPHSPRIEHAFGIEAFLHPLRQCGERRLGRENINWLPAPRRRARTSSRMPAVGAERCSDIAAPASSRGSSVSQTSPPAQSNSISLGSARSEAPPSSAPRLGTEWRGARAALLQSVCTHPERKGHVPDSVPELARTVRTDSVLSSPYGLTALQVALRWPIEGRTLRASSAVTAAPAREDSCRQECGPNVPGQCAAPETSQSEPMAACHGGDRCRSRQPAESTVFRFRPWARFSM